MVVMYGLYSFLTVGGRDDMVFLMQRHLHQSAQLIAAVNNENTVGVLVACCCRMYLCQLVHRVF